MRASDIVRLFARVLLITALVSALSSILPAQEATGRILGIVSDPSGAVVPGVHIVVTNTGTHISRETITDAGGGKLQIELRDTDVELDPDSDTAIVARGIAAVTPIVGIRAAGETDVAAFLEKELARPGQDWPGGLAASGS